jgi:hypothetical protein
MKILNSLTENRKKLLKKYLFVSVIIVSILYGVSFQQLLHFNPSDLKGIEDSKSYIPMSNGNYNVWEAHRYRFIVPLSVYCVEHLFNDTFSSYIDKTYPDLKGSVESKKIAFYIVNFFMVSLSAFFFFLILESLGFNFYLSLLGIIFFLCNRVIILYTATPLVDSVYFLAVGIIVYLIIKNKVITLSILFPLLVLSKETILFFIIMPPLFLKSFRKIIVYISIVVSFLTFYFTRNYINSIAGVSSNDGANSLVSVVNYCLDTIVEKFLNLFSFYGIHDIQNGFGIILIFAVCGFFINKRNKLYSIPLYFYYILVVTIGYMFLNGNFGRMLFASYVLIIPLALIFIEHFINSLGLMTKR